MYKYLHEFAMSFADAQFVLAGIICLVSGYSIYVKDRNNRFFQILSKNDTKHQMSPEEYSHFVGGLIFTLGIWFILATINGYGNFIGLSIFLVLFLLLIPIVASCILFYFKRRAKKTGRKGGNFL